MNKDIIIQLENAVGFFPVDGSASVREGRAIVNDCITQLRASEEENNTAVALLNELKKDIYMADLPYSNSWIKRINAVIAQSPLLPNQGINLDSPRLRKPLCCQNLAYHKNECEFYE